MAWQVARPNVVTIQPLAAQFLLEMNNILELNEASFETEVQQASGPVVVDFYASWCGPCKMLAPLLEQLAGEFQGQIKFTKLNVDLAPAVAGQYEVSGVPTLACFRDGKLVDSLVGLAGPRDLKRWLQAAAAAKEKSASAAPR